MTALQWVILSVILIVGIVLRLPLLSAGIGQDDCVTIYVAKAETFAELINRISLYEFNPPLYHLLMQQWLRMVGSAPDIVTGVSLFFGVLLIPLSFAFSRMFFEDNQKALLVAFFAAVSPISVFFSHEVRAYTLFACLAVCLWMAFFASLRKFSISRLAALFVVATLCLYTHYSSIIVIGLIGVFCIIQLLVREDEDGRKILGIMSALALSGLAFSFWLPHFLRHSSFGSFWVDPTPLRDFPFVVASNLAAIMPLPWLPALLIVSLALPLFLVLLLVRARKAKGVSFQSLKRQLRAKRELVFVLFNLITAACAFGYITPFIIGYTRYMVPFAAIGWIVCCMSVLSALPLMSRTP
ncbi:MAG: glycosyltransferase family 39 protein, partial [Cyanobacteria bacterium]|nr:glycosyltransferase family 39 protein [Cyanobacteriota bacterium]